MADAVADEMEQLAREMAAQLAQAAAATTMEVVQSPAGLPPKDPSPRSLADIQGKIRAAMQIDDARKVKEVLQESTLLAEALGDDHDANNERKALYRKYNGLIQAAEEDMREIGARADPEEMMTALRRYEDGYATYEGTEAYRSAKPAWAALRGEWYALHEAGLAGTRTSGGASPTSSVPLTLSREERAEQIWEEVAAKAKAKEEDEKEEEKSQGQD